MDQETTMPLRVASEAENAAKLLPEADQDTFLRAFKSHWELFKGLSVRDFIQDFWNGACRHAYVESKQLVNT